MVFIHSHSGWGSLELKCKVSVLTGAVKGLSFKLKLEPCFFAVVVVVFLRTFFPQDFVALVVMPQQKAREETGV